MGFKNHIRHMATVPATPRGIKISHILRGTVQAVVAAETMWIQNMCGFSRTGPQLTQYDVRSEC